MNENYTKLAQSIEARSKDLRTFVEERGDNITADDLAEARKIKDDIAGMRVRMKAIEEAEGLKGFADDARAFVEAPAGRHTHAGGNGGAGGAAVLGATKAGKTVFERPDGTLKRNKALRFVRDCGPSAFGKDAFEAAQTPEYRDAFKAMFKGRTSHPHFRLLEDGLDSQGGYLAPAEVIAKLIERKPAPTSVAAYCNNINTGRDRVTLPRVNYSGASDDSDGSIYTTGVRVTMTDENPTSDTQSQVNDTNLFGAASVDIFTWMLEANLTNNVIEDAMFDPLAWISGVFAQTIDLHKEKLAIVGYPGTTAAGLVTNPGGADTNSWPPVIKSGTSASPFITPDSLINMTEDLPTQYDSNVRYLYRRRTTGKTIRTFKDAQGRYLFGQGVQDSGLVPGRNQTLNDYPVSWSDFMQDPAANSYPVVAGDFSGVYIVNRIGFSVNVLREIAARRNQVIIIGRVRMGVSILEPWKLRALLCSA